MDQFYSRHIPIITHKGHKDFQPKIESYSTHTNLHTRVKPDRSYTDFILFYFIFASC